MTRAMARASLPLTALLLAVVGLFLAEVVEAPAARVPDVRSTKHNLSITGPGPVKSTSETQVCVFCHTPHGAESVPGAPLWNRKLSTATYTGLGIPVEGERVEVLTDAELDHIRAHYDTGVAYADLFLGELLGSCHHTELGKYEVPLFGHFAGDPRLDAPLEAFQARLAGIEAEITERNTRRPSYKFLLPTRIPQGVNI